jgi:apolipoprotein N-acyltransferase
MDLNDALDLWLKYRNAAEQRNYWFLLAQASALGLVVGNLNHLIELRNRDRYLAVFAVAALGMGSAIVTAASALAYRWDWDRLAAVSALLPPDHRAVFTSEWDQSALYGPFLFALFYFAVAFWLALTAHSRLGPTAVVVVCVAVTIGASLALTTELRSFLRDRRSRAPIAAAPNAQMERSGK